MREKLLILILSGLLLIGCSQKEEKKLPQMKVSDSAATAFKFDGYPVYTLSKDIDAITFELDEDDKENLFYNRIFKQDQKQDTLYSFENQLKPVNSTVIDTSGTFNIFRSEKLEQLIKRELKSTYYVYGTKGFSRVTLGEVYFSVDECLSNIVAVKIKGYDKKSCGKPLFCSEKPIGLVYGTDYKKAQEAIERFEKVNEGGADYMNPPGTTIVFGNMGSNYFTYEDDFSRKRNDPYKLEFPGRHLYTVNSKGKATMLWGYSLDLFGIPCD